MNEVRRYTRDEKQAAVALAATVGSTVASRQLELPEGTVSAWRYQARQAAKEGRDWPVVREGRSEPPTGMQLVEVISPAGTSKEPSSGGLRLDVRGRSELVFDELPPVDYLVALMRGIGATS